MDQKKIGEFITKLRKEKELTQEELADKLGVSSKSVSRWETGVNMPDYSVLNSICEEFDINVLELLNGEKEKENNKVFEEYMRFKEKANKRRRILYLVILFLIVIVFVLGLYFINSYRKVTLYKMSASSDNFSYTEGLLLTSNIKNVMKYGNLEITNNNINKEDLVGVYVAYKENDKYYLITSYYDGAMIVEDNGYGEIFNDKSIKHFPDDIYLVIVYRQNEKILHEELKMVAIEEMNNNKIINLKSDKGYNKIVPREIDFDQYDKSSNYKEYLIRNGFMENTSKYLVSKDKKYLTKFTKDGKEITFNYLTGDCSLNYTNKDGIWVRMSVFTDKNVVKQIPFVNVTVSGKKGVFYYHFDIRDRSLELTSPEDNEGYDFVNEVVQEFYDLYLKYRMEK